MEVSLSAQAVLAINQRRVQIAENMKSCNDNARIIIPMKYDNYFEDSGLISKSRFSVTSIFNFHEMEITSYQTKQLRA